MENVAAVAITVVAAFINAVSALMQHHAAGTRSGRELFHRKFIARMARSRWWIGGVALQILAGGLEAAALFVGPLVLVEPLLVTDLVFLMLILRCYYGVHPGRREWTGVIAICVGLISLLAAADPHGGSAIPSGGVWLLSFAVVGAAMAVGALSARRAASASLRAALAALVAGIGFGLTAALTKLVMLQAQGGAAGVFGHWGVYALMVSGIVSILALQSAFGAGRLTVSQPVVEISDPLVGAAFGVLLFGDTIDTGAAALLFEAAGAALTVIGVVLTGTAKRTAVEQRRRT